MGHHSSVDTSAMDKAMAKQQEQLDRMTAEEERKNRLAQDKTLRNIRTAAGGGGGFNVAQDKDTLG